MSSIGVVFAEYLKLNSFILLITVLIYVLYKWSTAHYDHFSKRNVSHDKPIPFFGTTAGIILQNVSFSTYVLQQYEKYKDKKYFGVYELRYPILVIRDPDLIRQVAVIDFEHFVNHRLTFIDEPLLNLMLNFLKDQKWRDMRTTLTPAFSETNLRRMFYLIEECCTMASQNLRIQMKSGTPTKIDLNDFFTRYIMDIIASVVFGIKPDSLTEKDNLFYSHANKMIQFTTKHMLIYYLWCNMAPLMKLFKVNLISRRFLVYFQTLVEDTIKFRSENNIKRFDMIQLLMDSRKTGEEEHTENTIVFNKFTNKIDQQRTIPSWTNDEIVAQFAGNPEVQGKLHAEIDLTKKDLNGSPVSYESLCNMKYLDMVISETLRKWTSGYVSDRVCTKPYTLEDYSTGHSVELKPGDVIWIPAVGLHYDPNNFPDPNKFDPERFADECRGFIKPYTYQPFGVGPRNCICIKFALLQVKAAIFNLFSEFRLEPLTKNDATVERTERGYLEYPKNGCEIYLHYRN